MGDFYFIVFMFFCSFLFVVCLWFTMKDRARAGSSADEGDARTTGQEGGQRGEDGQVWPRGKMRDMVPSNIEHLALT